MFQIIIDDNIVFSTDDRSEYLDYCRNRDMLIDIASELLPDEGFMLKLATK